MINDQNDQVQVDNLYTGPWLSLKRIVSPKHGISGYDYSHETRCQGRIVALLPFRYSHFKVEYLLRSEITPCWGLHHQLSAITGAWEGKDPKDDAVRELLEEAGYSVTTDDLVSLGKSYASKSADTVYDLYSVNLTGLTSGIATGDGSTLEDNATTQWVSGIDIGDIMDPQVSVMYVRLIEYLTS